jgi:hypothetical protein
MEAYNIVKCSGPQNIHIVASQMVVRLSALCSNSALMLLEGLCEFIKIRVRFEVFTAVTMKTGVFWDVTPCDSCKNRRFGGT